MRLIHVAAAAALALLPLGCGAQSAAELHEQATSQYQAGDHEAAVETAAKALEAAEAEGADRVVIWNIEDLRIKAMAAAGDADGVFVTLDRLASDYPQQIDADRYVKEARKLQESEPAGALALMEDALRRFPEAKAEIDPVMNDLLEIAKESGNEAMMSNLEQLGYIGN